jgi:hypothetical protein
MWVMKKIIWELSFFGSLFYFFDSKFAYAFRDDFQLVSILDIMGFRYLTGDCQN